MHPSWRYSRPKPESPDEIKGKATMKIRNICPIGDLDIPLLRRVVAAGEVVEVQADHAAKLLPQRSNYEPADDEAIAVLAEIDRAEQEATDAAALTSGAVDPVLSLSKSEGTEGQ